MNLPENISQDLLVKALNESRDGISIADAKEQGFPIIYVNQGFEKLTGYASSEFIGRNYRLLQGEESDQPELAEVRVAISQGKGCIVTLRNFRRDGSMFWNEVSIIPVHSENGSLTHFIGIHRDITEIIELEDQLDILTYTDPLLGIGNRRDFDERFADLLPTAQRIRSAVSLLMINLDYFKQFNEGYGDAAGDECLRRVSDCICEKFVRTTDCVARFSGGGFAVASLSTNIDSLREHAMRVCRQVQLLHIPHVTSPHKIVTVSIGGIHRMPSRDATEETFIKYANQQLLAAKHDGGNCVFITD